MSIPGTDETPQASNETTAGLAGHTANDPEVERLLELDLPQRLSALQETEARLAQALQQAGQ
ncbi:MAG: hypothetical protein Q4P06_06140 [Actinomycetaceae bacterium]|nr:hypothetical protein [Actinomycetaceae bacterium]